MRIIKLMADYNCHPLWEASPGVIGNIDPNELPLSEGLRQSLAEWARIYDATLNINDPASSGFPDANAEAVFKKMAHELGERLKNELGDTFPIVVKV